LINLDIYIYIHYSIGSIKNAILSHPLNIKTGLSGIIQECEQRQTQRRKSLLDWGLFKRQKKCTMDISSDWNQLELCAKWSSDHTFGWWHHHLLIFFFTNCFIWLGKKEMEGREGVLMVNN
jgi:hypothetical protein